MKAWLFIVGLGVTGLAGAEALDKYAVPVLPPQSVQTVAPRVPLRTTGLDTRQRQALDALRRLPPETRRQWMATFVRQEREAVARRDYAAAAYYQGILREAGKTR